jgi:hypothetical protein
MIGIKSGDKPVAVLQIAPCRLSAAVVFQRAFPSLQPGAEAA